MWCRERLRSFSRFPNTHVKVSGTEWLPETAEEAKKATLDLMGVYGAVRSHSAPLCPPRLAALLSPRPPLRRLRSDDRVSRLSGAAEASCRHCCVLTVLTRVCWWCDQDRLMFGTDFPKYPKIIADGGYQGIWNTFDSWSADVLSQDETDNLAGGTVGRLFGFGPSSKI